MVILFAPLSILPHESDNPKTQSSRILENELFRRVARAAYVEQSVTMSIQRARHA
jgi:hypothetical protein